MKKIMLALSLLLLAGVYSPANAMSHSAKLKKGQKVFHKKMRKYCGFSGQKFARYHTQDEWEEIWDDGKFQEEAKRICPRLKLKKIKKSWWEPVYEFTHEYAQDGAHVPHC